MATNSPIGIFDSGIGGLTLASEIKRLLPHEDLVYFGDIAHLPYGDKSATAIQSYSIKICNVLLEQNCKVILIACNSASSAAYDLVKEYVGSRAKVFNVIDPVVGHVVAKQLDKVGVIGTKQTIGSDVYAAKIHGLKPSTRVVSLSTPLLAPMIEEGFFDDKISHSIIAEYLNHSELKGIESLILGCTHYPLIKKEVSDYYKGKVEVVDSPLIVTQEIKSYLEAEGLISIGNIASYKFYVSDITKSFEESAKMFFGEKVALQHYRLWE